MINATELYLKRIGKTYRFEVGFIVTKGFASTGKEREAGSVEITIVGPKGMIIKGIWSFNAKHPDGTGVSWKFPTATIDGPECAPKSCFISATFDKSPTAYYDELKEGDRVVLFGFTSNKTKILLWRNNEEDVATGTPADKSGIYDPVSSAPGMLGCDFNNSITIGGPKELYAGNRIVK